MLGNDQPYSSLWESYSLEGFNGSGLTVTNHNDMPKDLLAHLNPSGTARQGIRAPTPKVQCNSNRVIGDASSGQGISVTGANSVAVGNHVEGGTSAPTYTGAGADAVANVAI